nr:MAG TPA: hypothetical protein [Caudoviricetes sp.]
MERRVQTSIVISICSRTAETKRTYQSRSIHSTRLRRSILEIR